MLHTPKVFAIAGETRYNHFSKKIFFEFFGVKKAKFKKSEIAIL